VKNKQTGLQRLLKILGIIALATVIVFSTAACDGIFGGGGGGNNSGNNTGNGNGGGGGGGGGGNGGGGSDDIMSLPSMKEQFSEYFLMMGNLFNPSDAPTASAITNPKLTRHFNVLTAENNMKPQYISTGQGTYNFSTADSMVNAARASGFQVVGHTLLWHSQNANWMNSTNCTLDNMKTYITAVVDHFKGKIYSWDVLNEVFPDGVSASANWTTAMRSNNPWFANQGSDFVYDGFLAARLADPDAILYYNDYNLDNSGKATMVRNMVRDVNDKYLSGDDKPAGEAAERLLIEGIGMQSHHNTNVQASSIKNSLELFKPLGVKISISELDVLAQGYSGALEGANKSPATGNNLTLQATRYGEYMAVFLQYTDIIERVSLWGVTDDKSWRSAGQPLLFDAQGKAKASYYSFVGAL
jgi:endo-1,4-beta-xylanase